MSHSYTTECPNCNESADACDESRPFDHTSIWCAYCGFQAFTTIQYMDLETLNSYREDAELKPLKKLPKQTFQW